nr:hypothetical protein [Aneurinibacillus sp. XH2]
MRTLRGQPGTSGQNGMYFWEGSVKGINGVYVVSKAFSNLLKNWQFNMEVFVDGRVA